MTRDSFVKNALNDDFVKNLLERLGPEDRAHVEKFAAHMAGIAEEAISKSSAAMSGKMPEAGIPDKKGS